MLIAHCLANSRHTYRSLGLNAVVGIFLLGIINQMGCSILEKTRIKQAKSSLQQSAATPRLEINTTAISSNAIAILAQTAAQGVAVAAVVKGVSAHPSVVKALGEAGVTMLADSRVINLRRIREAGFKGDLLLTRPAALAEAKQVVSYATHSLVSSTETARALSRAAQQLGIVHNVILMIESGDLREGIYPPEDAPRQAQEFAALPHLNLAGIGTNFACNAGVLPSPSNTKTLLEIASTIEALLDKRLELISAGNSSGLPLLTSCQLPAGINHYRIGETILLGTNATDGQPWPGTTQDTMVFVAEVIEVWSKPSVPWGETTKNAFGEKPSFADKGHRRRAIVNAGRQDIATNGLVPLDPCMTIINASSDHLIIDVDDCKATVTVGQEIRFRPDYPAVLAASTSEYVHKIIVKNAP
jgi:predicted amino acid racemase